MEWWCSKSFKFSTMYSVKRRVFLVLEYSWLRLWQQGAIFNRNLKQHKVLKKKKQFANSQRKFSKQAEWQMVGISAFKRQSEAYFSISVLWFHCRVVFELLNFKTRKFFAGHPVYFTQASKDGLSRCEINWNLLLVMELNITKIKINSFVIFKIGNFSTYWIIKKEFKKNYNFVKKKKSKRSFMH